MELPGIGKHCNEPSCRQLDFLPVKCDACKNIYCSEHYKYESHSCPLSHTKNVQVPICPLCSSPVPGNVNELPDIRVSRHIDSDCNSPKAISDRNKVYTNRCSLKGCKQKEMIKISCSSCGLNFCLKHRHPPDHSCTQNNSKKLSPSAQAALLRSKSSTNQSSGNSQNTKVKSTPNSATNRSSSYSSSNFQGNLSEEAALELAVQASLGGTSLENEDFLLARAIEESERLEAARRASSSRDTSKKCQLT